MSDEIPRERRTGRVQRTRNLVGPPPVLLPSGSMAWDEA